MRFEMIEIPQTPPPPHSGRRDKPITQAIMRQMHNDGHTLQAIAAYLNEQGYVTPHGKKFSGAGVRGMLVCMKCYKCQETSNI